MAKILIIDDEPDILDIVGTLLKKFLNDCTVIKADSGEKGIEQARLEKPDTILLDINMPVMDGYQVCQVIKSDPQTKNIPIIILTGVQTDSKSKIKALDLGADAFLPKPIKEGELIAHIKAMLRIKRAEDELQKEKELLNFLVQQRTEELNKAKKRYQHLYDFAPDLYFSIHPDGTVFSVNRYGAESLGYQIEELMDKPVWESFHPEDQSKVRKQIHDIFEKKITTGEWEFKMVCKDGSVIWVQEKTHLFLNDKGYAKELLIMCRNVTGQKHAEESIRESEQHYRTLFEHGNDAILLVNSFDEIVDANIQASRLVSTGSQQFLSGKFADFIKPARKAEYIAKKPEELELGEQLVFETDLLHKEGRTIPVEISISPFPRKNKRLFLIMLRDLTERRIIEEEVQKSQKLESIGILAGGIAHDFNNRLSVMLGNAQLARMNIEPDHDIAKYLENIEKGAVQATTLTQQLLTFSKGGSPVKKFHSIESLIKEAVELSLSGSPVGLVSKLPDSLWAVEVDEGQIVQVFNNLIINADQAMASGGKLEITAENVSKRSKKRHAALPAGNYIKVSIRDEGIGIPKGHQDKIFDPYFTTKNSGSGLGLAVAYSIIKKHNGLLTLESELGVGSTFIIYLPAEPDYVLNSTEEKEEHYQGQGRVLVMDDEESVLSVVENFLILSGYEVELAKDGAEAIDIYEKAFLNNTPFSAVVMDLTIPGGIGGKDAIIELQKIDPNIKAIVSSGYSNDPIMANYKDFGFTGVIAKPYKMNDLGKVLHDVITQN